MEIIITLTILIFATLIFVFKNKVLHALKLNSKLTTNSATPILNAYSRDLTARAREGTLDPVIDRDDEIRRLIYVLSRRTKNNPVLIGQTGVGKTAIVEGLAQEIAKGNVPQALKGKRVLALDLNSIIAGTKYRGEFEHRLKRITDELISAKRSIILFIDELHIIARAGEAEGTTLGAADILKPALARGELQIVGATTPREYIEHIREDETLERRFQPVIVDEPSQEESLDMLRAVKHKYEEHHQVEISDEALKESVRLAKRYIKHRFLPDKAIDLLDEACARASLNANGKNTARVTMLDIQEALKNWKHFETVFTPYHSDVKE